MSSQTQPKGLLTDVFGTVVDWRATVVNYLTTASHETLNSSSSSISSSVRASASSTSWPDFAQEWRKSYYHFTRNFDPDTMPFKSIDQHHLEALIELLRRHGLEGLWTDDECAKHSMIWHFLDPWPDSSAGLKRLTLRFKTATLSNGNTALLSDLASHGDLSYTSIVSAEDFKAYKPHPSVYNGGCEKLGLQTRECAMVAAHLGDLKAARGQGMMTVYIERKMEEEWDEEQINEAKGWVDIWIREDEGGFEELAKRLGC